MSVFQLAEFFGGLALFLFGMEMVSFGLRRASGAGLRTALAKLTSNRVSGLLAGVILSFGMQSSSAATVLLVGLVDAGLIAMVSALPVALGSSIGTTLTVQVIAFDVGALAMLLLVAGLAVRWLARYDRRRRLGDVVFGVGLIFFGMTIMSRGAEPLAHQPWFHSLLAGLADRPVLAVLASALLTGIIQGCAATVAVVISISSAMVGAGAMGANEALRGAIPLILGANIGTGATALLASAAASRAGKRVAVGNVLFKVGGVLLCLPFVVPFAALVWWFTSLFIEMDPESATVATRSIANAHTLFNILAALAFLPFVGLFQTLILRLVPEREGKMRLARSLAPRLLAMPDIALEAIASEVRNTAVQVRGMYSMSRRAALDGDRAAVDLVRVEDDQVDDCLMEVTRFAVAMSQGDLTPEAAERRDELLIVLRDLEQIGDMLSKVVVKLARKMIEKGLEFSPEGREDLQAMFGQVGDSFDKTLALLARGGCRHCDDVLQAERRMASRRRELFSQHLARLHSMNPKTIATMQIHMDLVTSLRQIHALLADIVRAECGIPEGGPDDSE